MRGRARPAGITLAEALVALALLLTCLALVATEFTTATRTLRQEEEADASVRTLRLCTDALGADLEQADFASIQPRGTTATEVSMQRVDPAAAIRGLALPTLDASPCPFPRHVRVHWVLENGRLRRELGSGSASLGSRISRFEVRVVEADPSWVDAVGRVEYRIDVFRRSGPALSMSGVVRPRVRAVPRGVTP